MKKFSSFLLLLISLSLSCKKEDTNWVDLLNYRDFSNWNVFVLIPEQKGSEESEMRNPPEWLLPKVYLSEDPESSTFNYQMHDGKKVLHISGELLGFITTKKEYGDYHLKYKFKFGKKWQWLGDRPRDGGIFYHVKNSNTEKEKSPHEFNIHDGDIGSYWSFGGYGNIPCKITTKLPGSITDIIPIISPVVPSLKDSMFIFDKDGTTKTFGESIPDMQICVANPIADNPCGEWNELDLVCIGDTIIHAVNGVVVNVLYHSRYRTENNELIPLTKGAIKIQSEGGEQFVEYIKIKEITEVPKEFRSKIQKHEIQEKSFVSSSTEEFDKNNSPKTKWVDPEIGTAPGLSHHIFPSKALNTDVGYVIWTPENYEKSTRHYPVIYFLHGVGGTEAADAGEFSRWLSKAIKEHIFPPAICVFPNGGESYYRGAVENMIVNELIPLVDKNYRTSPKADSRLLAGFSMGGEGAVYLSIKYPDLFCAAGSLGGELKLDAPHLQLAIENAIPTWKKSNFGFYLVNGDKDGPEAFSDFSEILTSEKIDQRIVILPDTEHNLQHYYERSVIEMLAFLSSHLK
ncbi:protein of unknown function [Mariniphaga anaerophila]|uniref:3-keto-alpha-glucoside-1,2-lyase/3-keto-2-hydroxy-glucal hydratase domain-containing protein n=1 Tax=Mariniphaga anaerophila TaxID=1484053 RepID=A0A1M4YZN7_9BACT|nr:alpha/beta hydrolase-fold protein [Mariniphaga anaerophila]SHF11293.1 protein of unknown function [Mariniphaga anaerophila]